MKLGNPQENKHVLGVQTPPRKSYNPFDSDDEATDAYSKSSINGYDIKSFETTADSLTFHLDSSDLSWEEAILGHSRMLSNSVTADGSSEEVLCRKDTELFTDKTITECELPELVFSYKDNGFYSVKDIGIDEGVPTHDKVWIKSQDNHERRVLTSFVRSDDDVNGDLPLKGLKSQSNNDVEKDPVGQARSEDSVKEIGLEHEVLEKPHSADQSKTDLLKGEEFEHDVSKKKIESNSSWQGTELVKSDGLFNGKRDPKLGHKDEEDYHKVEKTGNEVYLDQHCNGNRPLEDLEESPAKPSIEREPEASIESNESQSEEVELPALQEASGSVVANSLSYNSKFESGSIILDFNAASKVSGKAVEEIPQKDESVEKPPETQSMSRNDGGIPGLNVLDCGTDKRVHGETSFSAAMPLPASITYMGCHAHNGSISLRSESSTGSTRSFAFPVLQAEWNSSPVRMAKADQRPIRKQRGCIHSLICCKF